MTKLHILSINQNEANALNPYEDDILLRDVIETLFNDEDEDLPQPDSTQRRALLTSLLSSKAFVRLLCSKHSKV